MKRQVALTIVLVACAAAAAAAAAGGKSAGEGIGGFPSLRAAAAAISHDCAATTGSGLGGGAGEAPPGEWPARVVYAAATYGTNASGTAGRSGVFSSRGLSLLLGNRTYPYFLALWPCRPPVVFYGTKTEPLLMEVLAGRPSARTTRALGGNINGTFDPHGRLVTVDGTTVNYSDGTTVSLSGLPSGWQVDRVWPSPQNPRLIAVEVNRGVCPDIRLYLLRPSASPKRLATSSCNGPDFVEWSPDGARLLYSTYGPGSSTYVSDASGGHERRIGQTLNPRNAIWSPDGQSIAYSYGGRALRVAVVDIASPSVRRVLTPFRWNPGEPPYQPPLARPIAWSPGGKSVAILYTQPNGVGTVVEVVPARGGKPRILIRLPQ